MTMIRSIYSRKTRKFITTGLITLGLTSIMIQPVQAAQLIPAQPQTAKITPTITPHAPQLSAKSFILLDSNTHSILAQKNPDERLAPASLTKLMTLYLTFSALKSGQLQLDDKILVSNKAWRTSGSRMFVRSGTHVKVNNLIQGIIVDSGNDACVTIAEHLAGSESAFAQSMNDAAQQLGMTNSHFMNATGLPTKGHYSSAADLARLANNIVQQFPEYQHYFSQKWFKYNNIRQPNRNRLLWRDRSVDGMKTGHTASAGYCLIATAKRDNMRLISVVMGTRSDAARANNSQRLLNYGFRFFKTYKLFDANHALTSARIWEGTNSKVPLGLSKPLYVTVGSGDYNKLHASMSLQKQLKAPIAAGDQAGQVNVTLDQQVIGKYPLVALAAVARGSWWQRSVDKVKLTMQRIF